MSLRGTYAYSVDMAQKLGFDGTIDERDGKLHFRGTVGNQAESMQFSVLWDGECLIGQVGPATGDPVTVVVAPTEEGTCLIGKTRPKARELRHLEQLIAALAIVVNAVDLREEGDVLVDAQVAIEREPL